MDTKRPELYALPDGRVALIMPDREMAEVLAGAVAGHTKWSSTDQGHEYWRTIHESLMLPPIPWTGRAATHLYWPAHALISNKVRAIKLWRAWTGEGLKESKEAVEAGKVIPIRHVTNYNEAIEAGYEPVY